MKLNKNDFRLFNQFAFFWLNLAWLAFILTLSGYFHRPVLVLFAILLIIFGLKSFFRNLLKISPLFLAINIFVLTIILVFSIFSNPTIFSGRDQGSLSLAAIRLTQFGQIDFSTPVSKTFYNANKATSQEKFTDCLSKKNLLTHNSVSFLSQKITLRYCQVLSAGKALNFPGFYYTSDGKLITQFPLVYISWLAMFYFFFGINGFIVANAVSFYLFIIAFLFLLKNIILSNKNNFPFVNKNEKRLPEVVYSFIILLIIFSSFSFIWFYKFTLSENLALALLWTGVLNLVIWIKRQSISRYSIHHYLFPALLSLILLIFTRIEGAVFFILTIFVLFSEKKFRHLLQRKNVFLFFLAFIIVFLLFFIWNFNTDIYFYKTIAKAVWKDFHNNKIIGQEIFSGFNLLKILFLYGLLLPIIFGFVQIFIYFKKKKFLPLIPFFIAFPAFVYLFNPQISPDHPWMLRRFLFAVLPIAILYSTLLIYNTGKKNRFLAVLIFLTIIVGNIPASAKYLTFRPGENLPEFNEKIHSLFSKKDLVLIDRLASGDNQQMLSGPLNTVYNLNAVYFFNPKIFNKLDLTPYEKIFLITPQQKTVFYQDFFGKENLNLIQNYSINLSTLKKESLSDFAFPKIQTHAVNGQIFEIKR